MVLCATEGSALSLKGEEPVFGVPVLMQKPAGLAILCSMLRLFRILRVFAADGDNQE